MAVQAIAAAKYVPKSQADIDAEKKVAKDALDKKVAAATSALTKT